MDGTPPPTPVAAVIEPMELLMKTSLAGRTFVARHEGLRLKAYRDVVGVWTVGYGHVTGPPVPREGLVITRQEAEEILARDLAKFERAVLDLCKGVTLAQHEFDALVSFAFNVGSGSAGFGGSSVLRRLKVGDRARAADALLLWNKGGRPKRVIAGLATRRREERKLFLQADYGAPTPEEHKPSRSGPAA